MSVSVTITPTGNWSAFQANRIQALLDRRIQQFLLTQAEFMRGIVVKGFTDQGIQGRWKPLSQWTLAMRRFKKFTGTKALIMTGEMRKAVIAERQGDTAFCGILYQTRAKTGQPMVNLAKVHEFGATIVVTITPKMRRFLAMIARFAGFPKRSGGGGGLKGSSHLIIIIPPRPFMFPARAVFLNGLGARARTFFKMSWEGLLS